jgi:hypothetical protein
MHEICALVGAGVDDGRLDGRGNQPPPVTPCAGRGLLRARAGQEDDVQEDIYSGL